MIAAASERPSLDDEVRSLSSSAARGGPHHHLDAEEDAGGIKPGEHPSTGTARTDSVFDA